VDDACAPYGKEGMEMEWLRGIELGEARYAEMELGADFVAGMCSKEDACPWSCDVENWYFEHYPSMYNNPQGSCSSLITDLNTEPPTISTRY